MWLERKQLQDKFPWLELESDEDGLGFGNETIEYGTFGYEGEGWFDAYTALMGFRIRAQAQGATFVHDNVVDVVGRNILVGEKTGKYTFDAVVNCSGTSARKICGMLGINDYPISPRKRFVFVTKMNPSTSTSAKAELLRKAPLTIDPTGVYFRPERVDLFLTGSGPDDDPEVDLDDFEIDHSFFENQIWPVLAHRAPEAFEACKVVNAWCGHYDMNTFDCNAFVGHHPSRPDVYLCNGFSGHGVQHAPAIGLGLAQQIVKDFDGDAAVAKDSLIDLQDFRYSRVFESAPQVEENVV